VAWVGAFICHAWDLGGNRVIFNGKIETFKAKKKRKRNTLLAIGT